MRKVRWGVLGVANIAVKKVIPAMQRGEHSEIVAIASRDQGRAREAASRLGIPRAYGTYEALLADPAIDAIYIPLPNHLHVPWTIRSAERGKHVLCEKPIALSAADVRELIAVRDRTGVKIQEAFMVRAHPRGRWRARWSGTAAWARCAPCWARSATTIPILRTSGTCPTSAAARSWTSAAT